MLGREDNDWSSGLAFDERDSGRWSIIAAVEGRRVVGVLVLTVSELNGGQSMDLIAAQFDAGHYAAAIDSFVSRMAEAWRCRYIRMFSPRPVHRLVPGFERAECHGVYVRRCGSA